MLPLSCGNALSSADWSLRRFRGNARGRPIKLDGDGDGDRDRDHDRDGDSDSDGDSDGDSAAIHGEVTAPARPASVTRPSLKAMRRAPTWSMRWTSWVAITTVTPTSLKRLNKFMI